MRARCFRAAWWRTSSASSRRSRWMWPSPKCVRLPRSASADGHAGTRLLDFYARQAAARGQSRWLVVAFFLSLLAVAVALDIVIFSFFSAQEYRGGIAPLRFAAEHPSTALVSTLMV